MIYLLYGSDTNASHKKLNEIISEFRKKYGDLNTHKFDAEENSFEKIKSALETNSLFSANKLVMIKYASGSPERERLYGLFRNLKSSKDTIVLLERELDPVELSKLKPLCDKIDEFSVQSEPAFGVKDTAIFRLGDTFFVSKKDALRNLLAVFFKGHDEMQVFSYLANHSRTLLTIKSYLEQKKPVSPAHKIHPYVAKKAQAIVGPATPGYFFAFLKKFLEEDHKIKTGQSKPRESLLNLILLRK